MVDLELDDDLDLAVLNGDWKSGDALDRNTRLLLESHPGQWRNSPTAGVGITDYINDERLGSVKRTIIRQLELDGMRVERVNINEQKIQVNAYYEDNA